MRKSRKITPRSRQKEDLSSNTGYVLVTINGAQSNPVTLDSHRVISGGEYMFDVIGDVANNYNPCYHDKFEGDIKLVNELTVCQSAGGAPITVNYKFTDSGCGAFNPISLFRSLPCASAEEIDDFSVRADDHFKTAVKDNNSMANFLIELWLLWKELAEDLYRLVDRWQKVLRDYDLEYKRTGNHWLAWNFAIKPFIRDCLAFLENYEKAYQRLWWLRRVKGRPVTVRYRYGRKIFHEAKHEGFDVDFPPPLTYGPPPHVGYVLPTDCTLEIEYECKMRPTSWATVIFDIPDHLTKLTDYNIRRARDVLNGFYNPAKIIWEAFPFSWLIDYFLSEGVKQWTDIFDASPFKDAEVFQTGHTFKSEFKGEIFLRYPDSYQNNGTGWEFTYARESLGTFKYTRFQRSSGLPTEESRFYRLPLSWYQGSILTAIGLQLRRKR